MADCQTSSGPRAARFFGGKARDALRKLRKEVFPEFVAPKRRTLSRSARRYCHEEGGSLLVRRRVSSSPDPSGVCHCADSTAGVAVSSSMCHAFRSSVWVDRFG